jgi:hypothetical protein
MGHRAAQCDVGTVDWRAMYGPEAFVLRPPVFHSDLEAAKRAKQIDYVELEKKAREWAAARAAAAAAPGAGAPGGAAAAAADALLPGWAPTKDAQGRTYFWHRETKAVRWDKPLLHPPAAAPAAEGAAAPGADGAAAPAGEAAGAEGGDAVAAEGAAPMQTDGAAEGGAAEPAAAAAAPPDADGDATME